MIISLKPSTNFVQDDLYNSKLKKGVIFHKLRNTRNASKKLCANVQCDEEESAMTEDELKKFLKYCVVKNDKQKLKSILRETIPIRRRLLQEKDDDLIEFWHFYFVDTDMVPHFKNHYFHISNVSLFLQILFDFGVLFDHIAGDSLEKKWDILNDKPLSEYKENIDLEKVRTTDVAVWQLITIIMALKPRGDFWKALSSLIIFSEVRSYSTLLELNLN